MADNTLVEKSMRSVFVGNIPYEATEEKLRDIFCQVGPVLSFKLMYDRESGKPKGYGFCEYRDPETALSAMRNLNGFEIGGRTLRVDNACTEKSRMEMQNLMTGPVVENPYGDEVDPDRAPEAISKAVASLPPEQMFELMKQMKLCIQNNPQEARTMLLQNPQLAYALLQALVVMRIVDPQKASAMLHRTNSKVLPIIPSDDKPHQDGLLRSEMAPPRSRDSNPPPPEYENHENNHSDFRRSDFGGPRGRGPPEDGFGPPVPRPPRTGLMGDHPPIGAAGGPPFGEGHDMDLRSRPPGRPGQDMDLRQMDPRMDRGDQDMRMPGPRDLRDLPPGRDHRDMPPGRDLRDMPPGRDPRDMPTGRDLREMPPGRDLRDCDMPPGRDLRDMPPGRDLRDMPPGRDSRDMPPPGRDPRDIPPGRDPRNMPPGRDPRDMPPGRDPRDIPPGRDPRDMPPGRDLRDMPPGREREMGPGMPPGREMRDRDLREQRGPPADFDGRFPRDPRDICGPGPPMQNSDRFGGPPDPRERAADPREQLDQREGRELREPSRDPRDRDMRGAAGPTGPGVAGGPRGPVPSLPNLSLLGPRGLAGAAGADKEKAALIMQVLQLSDEQITMLPPEQRQSIMVLKEQIAKSSQR